MGIRESVKKASTGAAGIAAATAGLSTCHDGGGIVVDPVPPPLVCSDLSAGQSLAFSASKEGDVVTVNVRTVTLGSSFVASWRATRVGDAVGATVLSTVQPTHGGDSLVVTLQLATPSTTQVDFTVEAELHGLSDDTCNVTRTIHVSITPTGVQVGQTTLDTLPLPSRHTAQIAIRSHEGQTVALEARTGFRGPLSASWEVTGGSLDRSLGRTVRWTLPRDPGLYQAEVLLDYGTEGMAFDALVLEVRATT